MKKNFFLKEEKTFWDKIAIITGFLGAITAIVTMVVNFSHNDVKNSLPIESAEKTPPIAGDSINPRNSSKLRHTLNIPKSDGNINLNNDHTLTSSPSTETPSKSGKSNILIISKDEGSTISSK